jgi:enoyl-CoA hydratase/carnithine racemase
MSNGSHIQVERSDSTTTLSFDRPDSLNAVNLEILREAEAALADLGDDPADVLVVTGNGDATCAGMDQDLVTDPEYHEKYHEEIVELGDEIFEHLRAYPNPTIVAGKGALVGWGFVFSLYADFLVLGEETHLALPEIQYGIDSSDSVPTLTQLVGLRAAKEIAMTGDPIEPQRAHNLGLVNDVVPEPEVDEAAHDLAAQLAEYETDLLRRSKAATSIEL